MENPPLPSISRLGIKGDSSRILCRPQAPETTTPSSQSIISGRQGVWEEEEEQHPNTPDPQTTQPTEAESGKESEEESESESEPEIKAPVARRPPINLQRLESDTSRVAWWVALREPDFVSDSDAHETWEERRQAYEGEEEEAAWRVFEDYIEAPSDANFFA